MARPVVGEMDMHSVVNLATLQTPLAIFFPSKKYIRYYVASLILHASSVWESYF